jgi:hypothetical protein
MGVGLSDRAWGQAAQTSSGSSRLHSPSRFALCCSCHLVAPPPAVGSFNTYPNCVGVCLLCCFARLLCADTAVGRRLAMAQPGVCGAGGCLPSASLQVGRLAAGRGLAVCIPGLLCLCFGAGSGWACCAVLCHAMHCCSPKPPCWHSRASGAYTITLAVWVCLLIMFILPLLLIAGRASWIPASWRQRGSRSCWRQRNARCWRRRYMRTYWSLVAQLIWLPICGLPCVKAAEGCFLGRQAGPRLHRQQRVQVLAGTALLRADEQCAVTLCSLLWYGACLPCRCCRTRAGATLATSTSPSAPSTAAPATGKLTGLWFCLGFRAPRVVCRASCFVCS